MAARTGHEDEVLASMGQLGRLLNEKGHLS